MVSALELGKGLSKLMLPITLLNSKLNIYEGLFNSDNVETSIKNTYTQNIVEDKAK